MPHPHEERTAEPRNQIFGRFEIAGDLRWHDRDEMRDCEDRVEQRTMDVVREPASLEAVIAGTEFDQTEGEDPVSISLTRAPNSAEVVRRDHALSRDDPCHPIVVAVIDDEHDDRLIARKQQRPADDVDGRGSGHDAMVPRIPDGGLRYGAPLLMTAAVACRGRRYDAQVGSSRSASSSSGRS